MFEFRSFRNSDPPELRRIWHRCELGRGAATGFDADVFESVVFSQPYFDPRGLILAEDAGRPIGFLHAGFGANASQSAIDPAAGTICMVMVEPEYRRRGIGRELVRRGEEYLRQAGTEVVQAGPSPLRDPFYFGIYGGSQPAGFLDSDPLAAPFFLALGYGAVSQQVVLQRQLQDKGGPVGLRLMAIRRTTRLAPPETPTPRSWWWSTRTGRLDSLELALLPRSGTETLAAVTVLGLDFYIPRWQQRGIGLMDLHVPEQHRRKGYGQALLVEVCRRIRDESVTLAEAHISSTDTAANEVFLAAGFEQVDSGTVFQKRLES